MDWKTIEQETKKLSDKIKNNPDVIIPIVRGGLVLGRLLARDLKIKPMYCLTVEKFGEERRVTTDIKADLAGVNVLLLEDMLETGRSLIVARGYLEAMDAIVETACLYTMPISEIEPDYYLRQVESPLHFPWE